MLAYFLPGASEWILILVLGVLLFGRRLPEVGRQVGRALAELRRNVDQFRREIESDETIRDTRAEIRELKRATDVATGDLRSIGHTARSFRDPRRLLDVHPDEPRPPAAPIQGPEADERREDAPPLA